MKWWCYQLCGNKIDFDLATPCIHELSVPHLLSCPFLIFGFNVILFLLQDGTRVLLAVGVSYRLLIVKYDFFSKLQKWSCFLDLVEQCAKLDLQDSTSEVVKVIKDIRWCGLQIISVILKLSCKATENLGITDEDAFSCFLRLVLFTSSRELFLK